MVDVVEFWLDSPSIHQAPLIAEFARLTHYEVRVVISGEIGERRRRLGWGPPDFGQVEVLEVRDPNGWSRTLQERRADKLVIVSGYGGSAASRFVLSSLKKSGLHCIIQTEGWDPSKRLLSAVRWGKYLPQIVRANRNSVVVLGIGSHAVRQFSQSWPKARRFYEFGYFPQVAHTAPRHPLYRSRSNEKYLLFIGELIERKNIKTLVHSWSASRVDAGLTIVGDGELHHEAMTWAGSADVQWLGAIPHVEIGAVLQGASGLVLPSRFDGWGAVVSEALLSGVPVLCSRGVGASALLSAEGPQRGRTFRSDKDLTDAIRSFVGDLEAGVFDTSEIARWSEARLSASAASEYLANIIEFEFGGCGAKPKPPWKTTHLEGGSF